MIENRQVEIFVEPLTQWRLWRIGIRNEERMRVISARNATRREQRDYEEDAND